MNKEKDKKAYAHAEKAYMQGTLFFHKSRDVDVNLTQIVTIVNGERS